VFVFPSLFEGFPLAVIEAQAAGLRCLIASSIASEVAQSPELVTWLPLEAPNHQWAARALDLARQPRPRPPSTAEWSCDLRANLRALEERYVSAQEMSAADPRAPAAKAIEA